VIRCVLIALLLAACVAAPAQAGVLTVDDATDLAQSLADAQEEQDVCYGWEITNNFDGTPDVGSSNTGPGVPLAEIDSSCSKGVVVLAGSIDYSCSSCEAEDSASVSIRSSGMDNPPTVGDLENLGLKAGDLTGDKDDTTLVNMVNALPLLVADRGNAPYVPYEQAPAAEVPPADRATGKPGSDFVRDSWIWMVLCVLLIAAGPIFYLHNRGQHKPARATPPRATPPSTPAATPTTPTPPAT